MTIITHIERVEDLPLLKFKLDEEYFNILKQDAYTALENGEDVGFSLVGAIYEGKEVEIKTDYSKFEEIGCAFLDKFGNKDNSKFDLYTSATWVVDQKRNEYNPLHVHSSFLSGIIYIDVPSNLGISKDKRKRTEKKNLDGFITFLNGFNYHSFKPEAGFGYIFTSSLPHMVYPFDSDERRLCVSFNLEINVKVEDQPLRIQFNFNKDTQ